MKKAKIMLMAIAVIGVVGGALAFKAKKNLSRLYYFDPVGVTCTIPYTAAFITTTVQGIGAYGYVTLDPTKVCTYTFYTTTL